MLQQNTTDACEHVCDADKALTGTWFIDEVRLAVQKGYRIIAIYEVYEYTVTQYDPKTGHGGLFVGYIDTFLKLKAEASGLG
jgi:endo-beta-N-acetylglucosaminidase D